MSSILRDPSPADAPALARVQRDAWLDAYQGIFSAEFMDERLAGSEQRFASLVERSPDYLYLQVAEYDGALAGFSCVRPQGLSSDLEGSELTSIYIHPDFQRRGLGSLLLDSALGKSRQCLYAWVVERNTQALNFYSSAGFTPDGSLAEWHPRGATLLRLVKRLA